MSKRINLSVVAVAAMLLLAAPAAHAADLPPRVSDQAVDALLALGYEVVTNGASGRGSSLACVQRARWWECSSALRLDLGGAALRCRVKVLVWRSGWSFLVGRSTCPGRWLPATESVSPAVLPTGLRYALKTAALDRLAPVF